MKRTLLFFHLHSKGCLVCAHITNIHGEKYTLLPHLCFAGRDDSYVPTSSSMYCPQLLRIDNPDKRRELIRKLTNICIGCLRRRNPSTDCIPCNKKQGQPGKPCSECNGHFLLGTCGSCIQLSSNLQDRYYKIFADNCHNEDKNINTHLSDTRFITASSMISYPLPIVENAPPPKKNTN